MARGGVPARERATARGKTNMSRYLLLLAVLLSAPASAHDWYTDLVSPTGQSCCNGQDCEPAKIRQNATTGLEEVEVGGVWVPIDVAKVLPVPSPDGNAHVCWWRSWVGGQLFPLIRCIVLPPST